VTEAPEVETTPVTKVARDLTEILDLYGSLLTQAVHSANATVDRSHLPGGRAMVELGGVANIEAWTNQQDATERYAKAYTSAEDEDPDDAWPAFQLIEFWSEQWRAEHGAEYGTRPTIQSEANFLRYSLNWAWDHEPHFDEFAADIRRARLRLEGIVYAGSRPERTRIVCNKCEAQPRLIVLHGVEDDMSDDRWKCPGCKNFFDVGELRTAHTAMLKGQGADRWLHQRDAIDLLKSQERPERTVRQWLADGVGEAYCDPVTHEVWVWWPALWTKHRNTPRRNRRCA
jgi:hypothetical protein